MMKGIFILELLKMLSFLCLHLRKLCFYFESEQQRGHFRMLCDLRFFEFFYKKVLFLFYFYFFIWIDGFQDYAYQMKLFYFLLMIIFILLLSILDLLDLFHASYLCSRFIYLNFFLLQFYK